jgi:pyridoxal phosphate enzyme (YggS family)
VSLIAANMRDVLAGIPMGVDLVVVAKGRRPDEVAEAVKEGASIIGENYVQEAAKAQQEVGRGVAWHFIGHLQTNKVKKAVALFDMIQTVDSLAAAQEMSRCRVGARALPVLVEVNSAGEPQKFGVFPEQVAAIVAEMAVLAGIRIMGLMTMGRAVGIPAESRPYFRTTRKVFETLARARLPNVDMKYLSMGMSDSYREAIDEGANMVRLGRASFGER